MEKEKIFTNEGNGIPQAWNSIFGIGIQGSELNCSSEQLSNCFFDTNWDNSMDQRDLFEYAFSSIVSSPANSHPGNSIPAGGGSGGGGESIVLRELIGRLGSICNSGENGNRSTNTSCYNTPLNSPPKLNLSITDHQIQGNLPLPGNHQLPPAPFTDPGFVGRAARFSCFDGKNFGLKESEFPHVMESGKLSRVSSSQSSKTLGFQFMGIQDDKDRIPASDKKFSRLLMSSTPETTELGDSMEESSVLEPIPGGETGMKSHSANTNARKRKAIPKGKGKETPSGTISARDDKVVADAEKEESDAKRSKSDEEEKGKETAQGNQKQTKENAKPPEPPKDYIHVRARRGQATDSHSLAERVRREKISERMKFLQDLVPGCNKVTGKAVMLDEIINYVQSLQRQVEFLSMKLATVKPRMDVSMEALLSKDMFRSRVSVPTSMNPFDTSAQPFSYGFQSQTNGMVHDGSENQFSMNTLMAGMHRNSTMKPPHIDGFSEASTSWENDLQSVVQMGLGQNQPQSLHGQMKVEL